MNINKLKYLAVWLLLIVFTVGIRAEGKKDDKKSIAKTSALFKPQTGKFNINNISTWLYADGRSDINSGNSGFEYPKGSNKQIFYQSGFIWGGKVSTSGGEEIRVTGTAYRTSMTPGHVENGVPVDPNSDARARVFRVRPDYATADLTSEVNDGEGTEAAIRAQYAKDWQEWPDELGAPYTDVNGNGVYDPSADIAGFPGADQTLWYVNNDFDPDQSAFPYGSGPMGIEVQTTIWGYNRPGALGSVMFRKYTMINKSGKDIKEMYVSMWSDPDCGDATDDLAGINKKSSLMYIYNGKANDATYGYTPPAGGFDFFQGPIVDSPGDTAIFKGVKVANKKNLPATSFYYFINSNEVYNDPEQGDYQEGTLEFWNLFQGKIGTSGDYYPVPGGGVTNFPLDGDPLSNSGYVDGKVFPPGDRRLGMASGPFLFAANDTQEVVVAQIAAGAFGAVDRLGALGLLEFYDLEAQNAYDNFFDIPSAPPAPVVTVTESDESVTLNWSNLDVNIATEEFNDKGYSFEGYNVYQLPTASASKADAKRVATFDLNNSIGKITGDDFNVELGVVLPTVLQFGSDVGIKRYVNVTTDLFNSNLPLNNGSRYYYAVTSYAYNPDPTVVPQVLENSLSPILVIPQKPKPGNTYSDLESGYPKVHVGNGDAVVSLTVVEPSKLTGDEYQVFFTNKSLYRDIKGDWREQGTDIPAPTNPLQKDLTGADLDIVTTYGKVEGTFDLAIIPYGWDSDSQVDALKLEFPAGTIINSASSNIALPVIDSVNSTIQWGKNDTSGAGKFIWGETIVEVNVSNFTFPLTFNYTLYDDGVDSVVNANGAKVLPADTVVYKQQTEYYWNLKNVTKNTVLLENRSVYGSVQWYGGNDRGEKITVGDYTAPVVDGFQISLSDLTFQTPLSFTSGEQTVKVNPNTDDLLFWGDALQFSYADGRAYNFYGGGEGAEVVDLIQDLEFRFTGVPDPTYTNSNDAPIVSGGQMATIYNRGRSQNNKIRLPFEVWEVERNRQINVAVLARNAGSADDPWGDAGLPLWYRPMSRPYIVIIATDYAEDFAAPLALNDPKATWIVMFDSGENEALMHWDTGDIFTLSYPNNIVPGEDKYTFSTFKSAYSAEKAKADITEINVFPNPYYGVNPQELNKYQKFVTFSHLPAGKSTIRIFNLAGQLVNTIERNSTDQFERWYLDNDAGLPVASGLYIVHVDMPELGKTKILKVAIIQEQQILDRF